ncbi:hypothetical protein GYMLUDRAFT_452511 [Collybiopsis luxurians FD-317 M1]|uniref:NAD(P)-binding protein n=1 Tax=Collybiopsis luxurians FD-317 M1 TaxID=944289 RepID=A0A0D0CVN8_9AGAR|nr:hypothetical protein GYMLUDRAFT_452511 [Collybiopsis luxurians FD-317 M1]
MVLEGKRSWDASDIPNLTGRVAIVTGGNGGIGKVTVRELARNGAKVYMFSRSESRATAAIDDIKSEIPETNIEYIHFDLQSLKSAKKAANSFLAKEERLDILVLNAGIMAVPFQLTEDGIEIQACNGVGHAALTFPLLPLLKQTAAEPNSHVRIVSVASIGSWAAYQPDFTSLDTLNRPYWSTWLRYANSKLMNILFINELQKRLEGTGIYCLSVHPGIISTDLWLGMDQSWPLLYPFHAIRRRVMLTTDQGALTQLYAATSLEVEEKDLKAAYLVPYGRVGQKSPLAEDTEGKLGTAFMALCDKVIAEKS